MRSSFSEGLWSAGYDRCLFPLATQIIINAKGNFGLEVLDQVQEMVMVGKSLLPSLIQARGHLRES
jgi:hypothetical protein